MKLHSLPRKTIKNWRKIENKYFKGVRAFTFGELCDVIRVEVPLGLDRNFRISRLISQSEYTQPADAVICTYYYNVEQSVKMALQKGAYAIFCPKKELERLNSKGITSANIIGVDDPLESIRVFEEWRKKDCGAKVITITGSVGKTTTTGLIDTILVRHYYTLFHDPMSNSHGAILRNIQRLSRYHEVWVQEVGGVQPGYVESSARILCPDATVLTNISVSHLNTYHSKENIFYDKSSLERYMKPDGVVFINNDDDILRDARYSHKVITFGIKNNDSDYRAENIENTIHGLKFDLISKEGRFNVSLKLFGEYNAYNALAAIAVARWMNIPMQDIIEEIYNYEPKGIRQNLTNVGGYTMLVDCFNAEPSTVLGSAKTLSEIPWRTDGKRIFITGHIDKIGDASVLMHEKLGKELTEIKGLDEIVFFAGHSKYSYEAAKNAGAKNIHLMKTREELENWMRNNISRNDITAYKSGQFEAALAKSIDNVYGTVFSNESQYNGGTVEKDGNFSFRVRKDITECSAYEGSDMDPVIPDKYKGRAITSIDVSAFKESKITSVTIPDCVRNIRACAFYKCNDLKNVKFPENLQIIEKSAFNGCSSLSKVILPQGTIHIDKNAFKGCSALNYVYIPTSVGFIDKEAFKGSEKVIIKCESGSYAESFAIENSIKYCH